MRSILVFACAVLAGACAFAPARAVAQQPYYPMLLDPPEGLSEAPEQVLARYLMYRFQVTGELPILQVCGPIAERMMTPDLIRYLSFGSHREVERIEVAKKCPDKQHITAWIPKRDNEHGVLSIIAMSFNVLESNIEAYASPAQHPPNRFPTGRREHYAWNHIGGPAGQSIRFFDFLPRDD